MTTPQFNKDTPSSALPQGVVVPAELGSALQDPSATKFRSLAASRFPSVVNGTSAGNPANVGGPLGFVVNLFSNFTSNVAEADPADIREPDDLLPLANPFFSGLPLMDVLERLPIIGDIIEFLTGVEDGDPSDIGTWANNLKKLFRGQPITSDPGNWFAGADLALASGVTSLIQGAFSTWFGGGGGSGTIPEWNHTIESIKDAVLNGYTVHAFTSTTPNWTDFVGCTELKLVGISAGNNGSPGSGTAGGAGGAGGKHQVLMVDPTSLSGIDVTIPTAGNDLVMRVANTSTPHTGVELMRVGASSPGGIAVGPEGFAPTASNAAMGGTGGQGNSARGGVGLVGSAGSASNSAAGGTGGAAGANSAGANGGTGGDGASVSAGAAVKCGGGGGGGGGGAGANFGFGGTGGKGGDGGYPGGGGGGGGGRTNASVPGTVGSAGAGAPGVGWAMYK